MKTLSEVKALAKVVLVLALMAVLWTLLSDVTNDEDEE